MYYLKKKLNYIFIKMKIFKSAAFNIIFEYLEDYEKYILALCIKNSTYLHIFIKIVPYRDDI